MSEICATCGLGRDRAAGPCPHCGAEHPPERPGLLGRLRGALLGGRRDRPVKRVGYTRVAQRIEVRSADGEVQVYDSPEDLPEPLRSSYLAARPRPDDPPPAVTVTDDMSFTRYEHLDEVPEEHREMMDQVLSAALHPDPDGPRSEVRITVDGQTYESLEDVPEPARSRIAEMLDAAPEPGAPGLGI